MKLYKKNNKIYVDYSTNGKRTRKSLNLRYTKENLAYANRYIVPEIYKEIELGCATKKLYGLFGVVLENVSLYKKQSTLKTYQNSINVVKKHLCDKEVSKYNIADFENMYKDMFRQGKSSGYIKTILIPVYLAFKEAKKLGINTISIPKIEKKVVKLNRQIYSQNELRLLLENAKGELKLFLYIAIYTGARSGEIIALKKDDIMQDKISISKTLQTGTGKIDTPKNGKTRFVPISDELKYYLNSIELNENLFSMSYMQLKYRFKKICDGLKLHFSGFHTIRHTFTSIMLSKGVNQLFLQNILGHNSLDMIHRVYSHYIENENDINSLNSLLMTPK